jgi:hypothetical protein
MGKNIFNVSAGAVILPNNKILGEANNEDHLIQSQKIADLIISSNYFKN